jgi:hypothetical protein
MRDRGADAGGSAWTPVVAATVALVAAAYLTFLAVDFIRGGCDCGGGAEVTAAGIVRAAILIGGAAVLYVLALVAGARAIRQALRSRR